MTKMKNVYTILKMRNILSLTVALFTASNLFAQSAWKLDDYSRWNHTNFRQNQIFNKPFSNSEPDYLLLDAALFFMTNEERSKVGVAALRYHRLLEVAAYNHSMKMATTGFFSHKNSVDPSRSSTSDRGKLAGISNPSFAENIAYNYPESGSTYLQVAEKLIDQWMNSPGHKDNILSVKGRQMAAGTYYSNGRIYGTQVFQWFSDVIEDPNGGRDHLPQSIEGSYPNNDSQGVIKTTPTPTSTPAPSYSQTQTSLPTQGSTQKSQPTTTNTTKVEQSTNRKTDLSKSSSRSNESHALTLKIGLNTFYPSLYPTFRDKFNSGLLSFGAETMLGVNFGNSYRRNSLGLTFRVSQTNRFLTQALDSTATLPLQYFDAELTTLIREWLSFGVGATYNSTYGSTVYQISPAVSLGLCLGPKNWKIQLTQQASLNPDQEIVGRAFFGIALRI